MIAGIELCEKKMGRAMERKAKVVTHTAEGDIHDIGMQIVNALLRANGYDVITLRADASVEDIESIGGKEIFDHCIIRNDITGLPMSM
jgi:methanol corrinoid protein